MEQKFFMRTKTPDGYVDVEVPKAVYDFDIKNRREMWRIDKREQRNTYSIDAMAYEGNEFGYCDTYSCEEKQEKLERHKLFQKCLVALRKLTPTQQRRFIMHVFKGYTYEQIAEIENVDKKSVYESVQSAIKKIRKYCENAPTNT